MRYIQILSLTIFCLLNNALFSQNLIFERFTHQTLNPDTWNIISGNPLASPSFTIDSAHPYSLKLAEQDEIHSHRIEKNVNQRILVSFFYRTQNAESGDRLIVRLQTNLSSQTRTLYAEESTTTWTFFEEVFRIHGNSAQLELKASCDEGYEAFYIDNIKLMPPADISVAFHPDPPDIHFSHRDTSSGEMYITNNGMDTLFYNLSLKKQSQSDCKIAVFGYTSNYSDFELIVNMIRDEIPVFFIDAINLKRTWLSGEELSEYDAVLFYPSYSPALSGSLGDMLADYVDSGGCLVLTGAAHEEYCINGRFERDNYFAIEPIRLGYIIYPEFEFFMQRLPIPSHPIMREVPYLTFSKEVDYNGGSIHPEAFLIAQLNSNFNLSAIRFIRGNPRVDICLNPENFDSPEYITLLANSLKWVAQQETDNVLSLSKYYGILAESETDTIFLDFDSSAMTLDSLYSHRIQIYSNTGNSPDTLFNITAVFEKADYDFDLSEISPDSAGYPGRSFFYTCSVKNCGRQSDGYYLFAENNKWPVDFYDHPDGSRINPTEQLAAGDSLQFSVKIDIPAEALYYETDSLTVIVQSIHDPVLVDTLEYVTGVIMPPDAFPWQENFSKPSLDSLKWRVVSGNVLISDEKFHSSPYSLVLQSGDEIVTTSIYLHDSKRVQIEYYVQYSENSSSQLKLSYFNGTEWIVYRELSGNPSFSAHFYSRDNDIYQSTKNDSIQFKFQVESTDSADTSAWYIDDIHIYEPGLIAVTTIPENFNFDLMQGDTVSATIQLTNTGGAEAYYSLVFYDLYFSETRLTVSATDDIQKAVAAMKQRRETQAQDQLLKSNLNDSEVIQFASAAEPATSFNVAILGCEYVADVYEKIISTEKFASVTMINARVFLPTLNELAAFDALFVYSGEHFGFYRPDSLSALLADFVDMGKGVVIAGAVFAESGNRMIGGRFREQNYYAIEPGRYEFSPVHYDSLDVTDTSHPITHPIGSFRGNFTIRNAGSVTNSGTTIIARWEETQRPLIVTRFVNNTPRVDLSFLPYSSDADPESGWLSESDGAMLMANAISWTASAGDITRLVTLSKYQGTILPQQTEDIKVSIQTDRATLDKNYQGIIAIRQENAGGIPIKLNLQINSRDYYFSLMHNSLRKRVVPGQHVNYRFSIHNNGSLTDSYRLQFVSPKWQMSFKDAALKNSIHELFEVPPNNVVSFFVQHEAPASEFLNQQDELRIKITSMSDNSITRELKIVTSTEWMDTFDSGQLDTTKWKIIHGEPRIYESTNDIRYLRLPGNSAIETKPLNFSFYKEREIYVKFLVSNTSVPESVDLSITANNGLYWTELMQLEGENTAYRTWTTDSCLVPVEFLTDSFKVRFETGLYHGYWHFDMIEFIDVTSKREKFADSSLTSNKYSYHLTPNFPNPFNPVTRIHYTIPEAGHVRISIFNLLGQNVITLVDEVQQPGHHFATWDGSNFAAGLYFYRIEINQFVKTRKMILMK